MTKFAHIVNVVPLTKVGLAAVQTFTYVVPPDIQGQIRLGQLVKIPFGPRLIEGVISSPELTKLEAEAKGLKEIKKLLDPIPALSEHSLSLARWMSQQYVAPLGMVVKAMLPKFVKRPKAPGLVGFERSDPDFVLTEYQRRAVNIIAKNFNKAVSLLLHGVTGSGKTEVYMRVIRRLVAEGKQTILLVPEISLTPQAIERFARRFGMDKIAVLHSRMKSSERFWMWEEIRAGRKLIIIGPRSAVFAPVADLGMVVIDEEHDSSYKQYDQNPKYHARTVAAMLSKLWQCPLVLGDATPSVETFYRIGRDENRLLTLPHRIKADVGMPKVQVVDMRKELEAGNTSIFSETLKAYILVNLKAQKQIILFLNRRGTATVVMCRDCGHVLTCSNCTSALVWHAASQKLLCHHCDNSELIPTTCPKCGSLRIKQFGVGTQRIEAELNKFLKENLKQETLPKIVRMDRDSTRAVGSGEKIYKDWNAGKTQILIGTQMISKGWDVSRVGLVGIISADTTLHLPDYRSNERTFQILTQVSGRTGRGDEAGMVVLQTYHPANYAVKAAKAHDYETFFQNEIKERKLFSYPPFVRLVKLQVEHAGLKKAQTLAQELLREILAGREFKMDVFGPSPAFIPRRRGKYRFQIILKIAYNEKVDLYDFFKDIKTKFSIDVDPESLL